MSSPRLGRLLRIGVAAALTLYVLWQSDPSAILQAAALADLRPILAAVGLVLVDRTLMAYRWMALLCNLDPGVRPPFREVLRIFFVSTFVGTFLPASVGGDAVRAYSLSRHDVPGADALASVLVDRLLGVVSILIVGTAGVLLVPSLRTHPAVLASLVVAAAATLAGAAFVFSGRVAALAGTLASLVPWRRARALAAALVPSVRRYAGHSGQLMAVLVASVGVQVLRILQAWLLGRALHIEAGPLVYFAFVPLILLVMLLPVTVNGIGTSQAAFVWLFGLAGVESSAAFALSVLFVALGVVGNLPGGLLYAVRGLTGSPAGRLTS